MVRVAHKYMPEEAPEEERIATFAARHHTLDYLTKILRDQVSSRTLNSALITGPRGAGKTTLVLMLVHRIEHDEALRRAWLPVRFAEELPGVTSLRDLLSEALRIQTEDGVAGAREWHEKAEAEDNDDQSLEIAALGLRQIAQTQKRRFVFFVENLDLVFDRGLDEQEEAHLRRLLMDDPFFMILGTAVRLFPQLTDYEKAFFNYFNEVSLPRLDDREVEELLLKRAEYHNNDIFKQRYARNRPSIRAISRLTGGNPRLVTDLYEIFSEHRIEPVVSLLRKTIDELTPLLKDVLEGLTPQQSKVLDALMRRGGSASPSEIAGAARLGLNTVTTQLTRLREAQLVEVHGGGKGRKAYYIVPDQLFCTWYQMRYLRPNRRRIELIVEFLRVCFDEEDRLAHLRELLAQPTKAGSNRSLTAEYFAASLIATDHERLASELAVQSWLDEGRMAEAAFALAEFNTDRTTPTDKRKYAAFAHAELGRWLDDHGGEEKAEATYREALRVDPNNTDAQLNLALILARGGEEAKAILLWTSVISYPTTHLQVVARSLFNRGVAKSQLSNTQGAIDDYSAVLQLEDAPVDQVANSLINRGVIKGQLSDTQGAIDDYTAVLQLEDAPVDQIARSLFNRGVAKGRQGDTQGEIDDYSAVLQLVGAPVDQIAISLFNRGVTKGQLGDTQGAIADYSAVLQLEDAPVDQIAKSLLNRGVTKGQLSDTQGAIDDFSAVLQLEDAPVVQIAKSLVNRGVAKGRQGDTQGAIDDYSAVLQLEAAPVDQIAISLFNRGVAKGRLGDTDGEIGDFSAVLQLENAPVVQIAESLVNRGVAKGRLGDTDGEIDDFSAVLQLEDAPVVQIAKSLFNRGLAKGRLTDTEGAIDDFSAVLRYEKVQPEQAARALLFRSRERLHAGEPMIAMQDLGSALSMEELDDDDRSSLLSLLLWIWPSTLHKDDRRAELRDIVRFLVGITGTEQRSNAVISMLHQLAVLKSIPVWLWFWHELERQLTDDPVVLDLLRPLAEYLQTDDPLALEKLPPDHRELAETLLRPFREAEDKRNADDGLPDKGKP